MIKSMTGFGRAEIADKERQVIVEIKSVNHRYLDFNLKMPKKLSFFEASIRNLLKEYMQRGKVDVFITYEDYTKNRVAVTYHKEIASEYLQYLQEMCVEFNLKNDIQVSALSRFPEVFTMEEQTMDEKELWSFVETVVHSAAAQFSKSREVEGMQLQDDIFLKLDGMNAMIEVIEARSPEILKEYRKKLENKTKELLEGAQMEESRIAAEVVLFADKICTDEETVRLKSHCKNMKQVLAQGEGIGRKLDFIAQEMNREANTILSKANDLEISNVAIDLKTEIEKIREQIQNIE